MFLPYCIRYVFLEWHNNTGPCVFHLVLDTLTTKLHNCYVKQLNSQVKVLLFKLKPIRKVTSNRISIQNHTKQKYFKFKLHEELLVTIVIN